MELHRRLLCLGAALAIRIALGHVTIQLPNTWWMYLGGPLGLLSIGLMAILVRGLGLLMLGVASTAGQLLGSVLIDELIPSLGNTVYGHHHRYAVRVSRCDCDHHP